MTYTEMMVYCAIIYVVIFGIICMSTLSYAMLFRNSEKNSLPAMFHVGRPAVQFVIIFMVVSIIVMTSKYFKVRTFEQVVACEKPGSVYSLNIKMGLQEPVVVKNQESIHKILVAFEETTFLPSFKESSILTKASVSGREINLEFLGMVEMDSITISSRGILYNNTDGQAYEFTDGELFKLVESVIHSDGSL